jgi:type III secretion protein L
MWPGIGKDCLTGPRVLDAATVRRLDKIDQLERRLAGERAEVRGRLATRLRRARQRALRLGRAQGMAAVGRAFGADYQGWRQWLERLERALGDAVEQLGNALPRPLLLEKQLREGMAMAARDTVPLTIHANARTLATVERILADLPWAKDTPSCALVVTAYLADDACIIETPRGLIEGHVDLEVAAFCRGVREALEGADAGLDRPGATEP